MFLFFDIDGTLFDHDRVLAHSAAQFHSDYEHLFPIPTEQFVREWHERTERSFDRYASGEISHQEHRRVRMRELFATAGKTMTDRQADALSVKYLRYYEGACFLYDDVVDCLRSLEGRAMGIISNGEAAQQEKKLVGGQIESYFSVSAYSTEVGIAKPAVEIFHEAARRAERAPEECIYVGDKYDVDALGCQAAGMRAVWLNRTGAPTPDDSAVAMIHSLAELEAVL